MNSIPNISLKGEFPPSAMVLIAIGVTVLLVCKGLSFLQPLTVSTTK